MKKVAVTGAGGFIGGHVVEALARAESLEVMAGVHRWANAARIARWPVQIEELDVLDRSSVDEFVCNVDYLVHCAVGSRDVTVEGTERVLAAAHRANVERVVHLSTVEVYGNAEGEVDEETRIRYTGNSYADSKIDAEKICQEYAERGVQVAVLRAPVVYGPFSDLWTLRPARRLVSGEWTLPEAQGICNLLYVSDLVRAVRRCLTASFEPGAAFNINGPDQVSWRRYFEMLAESLGVPASGRESRTMDSLAAILWNPVLKMARFAKDRFDEQIMFLYTSHPKAKDLISWIQETLTTATGTQELALYRRQAFYSDNRAQSVLGYEPRIGLEHGLELSSCWLRHHEVI